MCFIIEKKFLRSTTAAFAKLLLLFLSVLKNSDFRYILSETVHKMIYIIYTVCLRLPYLDHSVSNILLYSSFSLMAFET